MSTEMNLIAVKMVIPAQAACGAFARMTLSQMSFFICDELTWYQQETCDRMLFIFFREVAGDC